MKQQIKPITEQERAWIDARLDESRAFVDTHSPGDAGHPLTIDGLDRALAGWAALNETEPGNVAAAVDVVAVTFGRFLEKSLDFSWVTVGAGQETELALHGLPGRGDVLIFPQDLVGRRGREGGKKLLKNTVQQIAEHVGSLGRSRPKSR
jgi:Domain of unknown function (DUF3806)